MAELRSVSSLSPAEEGELYVMFDHVANMKKLPKTTLKLVARQMELDVKSVYEAWEAYRKTPDSE